MVEVLARHADAASPGPSEFSAYLRLVEAGLERRGSREPCTFAVARWITLALTLDDLRISG
ncbi:hypothetical protein BJY27_008401 [Streptomyces rapamycinicus]|uniref:Uncharacterized protein n=2 Tax=Streptomyces rapamycinicus TaxID=1226757 RepID=A0A3L8QWK2_STRRN|nr:hypothetical protein [Streptomyces rapamycinicus]RLV71700.1 hypothetical protein D3C57_144275 [Streptomyces rapamycinicus NRRL 5491]